jgi:hypothetical protein
MRSRAFRSKIKALALQRRFESDSKHECRWAVTVVNRDDPKQLLGLQEIEWVVLGADSGSIRRAKTHTTAIP